MELSKSSGGFLVVGVFVIRTISWGLSFFESPYNEDHSILGFILGPPIVGNYHRVEGWKVLYTRLRGKTHGLEFTYGVSVLKEATKKRRFGLLGLELRHQRCALLAFLASGVRWCGTVQNASSIKGTYSSSMLV